MSLKIRQVGDASKSKLYIHLQAGSIMGKDP